MRRPASPRLFLLAAAALALVPFASPAAWGCPRVETDRRQLGSEATAVFTGTVARVTGVSDGRVVNFDVDTVYKGERNPSIDVHTGFGGADCGIALVLNDRYTVFAVAGAGRLEASGSGAIVRGGIEPARYGLPAGVGGLHRPLSPWLFVFSVVAGVVVLGAIVIARRRRAPDDAAG